MAQKEVELITIGIGVVLYRRVFNGVEAIFNEIFMTAAFREMGDFLSIGPSPQKNFLQILCISYASLFVLIKSSTLLQLLTLLFLNSDQD